MTTSATLDRERLAAVHRAERERFAAEHPRSRELFERGQGSLARRRADELDDPVGRRLPGVRARPHGRELRRRRRPRATSTSASATPARWPATRRPPTVAAVERRLRDPAGSPRCCRPRTRRGSARSSAAASACRCWQFALTATDANRLALRLAARSPAGRRSSSSTTATTAASTRRSSRSTTARAAPREGNVGAAGRPDRDDARRRVQRPRRRSSACSPTATSPACSIEPALTNIGIVLPERRLPRRRCASSRAPTGTLLVIDETHTLCAGPGGCTRACGPRARRRHDRQGDRRRDPDRRLRHERRASPSGSSTRSTAPTWSTSAASAARSRATRCRSPPSARRSRRCSPTRRSSGMIALCDRFAAGVAARSPTRGRAVVDRPARRPGRVPLRARAAAHGGASAAPRGRRARATSCTSSCSTAASCITPFHNMALMSPGDDRGRRRPAHRGVRRGGGRADRLSGAYEAPTSRSVSLARTRSANAEPFEHARVAPVEVDVHRRASPRVGDG